MAVYNKTHYPERYKEIPKPVIEIIENLVETVPQSAVSRDLEIALRLRLRIQEINYRFAYLLLLEQELKRQEREAVELLLLH